MAGLTDEYTLLSIQVNPSPTARPHCLFPSSVRASTDVAELLASQS